MRLCPVCFAAGKKVEMLLMKGVPPWLNVESVIDEHPVPIIKRFAKRKVRELRENVERSVKVYSCPKCGFIALFEVGSGAD